MTRITVIGGTGYAGGNIVRAAAARGHEVTTLSRTAPAEGPAGVRAETGSATEPADVARAIAGAEVVVVALSPRGEMVGRTAPAIAEIASQVGAAGARLGVIGGAGSLLVSPGGPLVSDGPDFPAAVLPEAKEMGEALDALRADDSGLDWFFVSPAGGFGSWAPGEATGEYRVGGDVLLVDEEGSSFISGADFGAAIVDEIERPAHRRARFTVAY